MSLISLLFDTPSLSFFVTPRRQPRGPSALARLGKTSRDAVLNEVRGDAVPSEVRDASLSLEKTGWWVSPLRLCPRG